MEQISQSGSGSGSSKNIQASQQNISSEELTRPTQESYNIGSHIAAFWFDVEKPDEPPIWYLGVLDKMIPYYRKLTLKEINANFENLR